MFESLIEMLGLNGLEKKQQTRRRFIRRPGHQSLLAIDDKYYVVKKWSQDGILFDGSNRELDVGDKFLFTLKFRLDHAEIDIQHEGNVVRKTGDQNVAVKFAPLPAKTRQLFDRVIDFQLSSQFAQSQAEFEEAYA